MSNKTDLQTLNTQYESLIQTLSGKAAGGSGGGEENSSFDLVSAHLQIKAISDYDITDLYEEADFQLTYLTVENNSLTLKTLNKNELLNINNGTGGIVDFTMVKNTAFIFKINSQKYYGKTIAENRYYISPKVNGVDWGYGFSYMDKTYVGYQIIDDYLINYLGTNQFSVEWGLF